MVIYHFYPVNLPRHPEHFNSRVLGLARSVGEVFRCHQSARNRSRLSRRSVAASSRMPAERRPRQVSVDKRRTRQSLQKSLGDLLGVRRKAEEPAVARAGSGDAGDGSSGVAEIRWTYVRHDGGSEETLVEQQQLEGGLVLIDGHPDPFKLIAKGTNEMKYYTDADSSEEVEKRQHGLQERRCRAAQEKGDASDWRARRCPRARSCPPHSVTRLITVLPCPAGDRARMG